MMLERSGDSLLFDGLIRLLPVDVYRAVAVMKSRHCLVYTRSTKLGECGVGVCIYRGTFLKHYHTSITAAMSLAVDAMAFRRRRIRRGAEQGEK